MRGFIVRVTGLPPFSDYAVPEPSDGTEAMLVFSWAVWWQPHLCKIASFVHLSGPCVWRVVLPWSALAFGSLSCPSFGTRWAQGVVCGVNHGCRLWHGGTVGLGPFLLSPSSPFCISCPVWLFFACVCHVVSAGFPYVVWAAEVWERCCGHHVPYVVSGRSVVTVMSGSTVLLMKLLNPEDYRWNAWVFFALLLCPVGSQSAWNHSWTPQSGNGDAGPCMGPGGMSGPARLGTLMHWHGTVEPLRLR